jgi:hypothetical protein
MMSEQQQYRKGEFDQINTAHYDQAVLQIRDGVGQTKWLMITPDEFVAIQRILVEGQ